jgi:hypothetical protein
VVFNRVLTLFSSGLFLFLFCLDQPVLAVALILLLARLVHVFAHIGDTSARNKIRMWKIKQRPYAKHVGLRGDVELGFRSWLPVVPVFLNASLV